MKTKKILIIFTCFIILYSTNHSQTDEFPVLKGPYLGQKLPGMRPETFAPGIVSTRNPHEFSCTFSADGKEFYFNRGMTIMVCRWQRQGWTPPEPAPFNGDFRNHEPHITTDNQTLFFGSMRPNPDRPEMENPYGIWKVERRGKTWGEPSYVGYGMYVTTTRERIIYITDIDYKDLKNHGIARTRLINGCFGPFERQKGGVLYPSPGRMSGRHPCIAPDESFLIFDSYTIDPPGENAQLFVCFRESLGSWGKAINLSKILKTEGNIAASLSPDGRYLFFTNNGDINWVDARIIQELKPKEFPVLKGPYLGQRPPGMKPEMFAPGIISISESEGSSGFLSKGSFFVFQRFIDRKSYTYLMRLEDNQWTGPVLVPFWKQMVHNGDFTISPNDRTLIYQVKKEIEGRLDSNIWRVDFQNGQWGICTEFKAPINTPYDESFASEASNGNLYFFSRRPGGIGKSDLYVCFYTNGRYSDPINLKELNTPHHEWDPYIAPDESFIIFCSTKPGGMGQDDLYISFRNHQNQWCEPIHLDEGFNSPQSENRPYVTNDGRYFFFTSTKKGNRDIYWVDAKIIDELKTYK